MPDPGSIRFPGARGAGGNVSLSLPRRRAVTRPPFDVSDASAAARESIKAIVSATRAPFGSGIAVPPPSQVAELERSLRQLELTLAERERSIAETEARLAEQERDLAEGEALLRARERLILASRRATPVQASVVSPEEKAALEAMRAELERQDATLKEAKQAQREREQFIDESETKLFEKVQAQQEKEIELEQREEDLRARERRFREREAAADPQAAAILKAEDEKGKQRDEFNE
jgi:uncharacterized coiled-coil protein SlyX